VSAERTVDRVPGVVPQLVAALEHFGCSKCGRRLGVEADLLQCKQTWVSRPLVYTDQDLRVRPTRTYRGGEL
jgi:hypothetical protein